MSVLRNTIYYNVKPFLPRQWRTAVRRRVARRQRRRVSDIWPIMPGSEKAPPGWLGWPNGKKFAVVLTHDVEGQSGLDKCRKLITLELKLGFRSSFNFIPEGSYRVPPELRSELEKSGFEVGVHDLRHDGRLFSSRTNFQNCAVRINHYLREWNALGFRSGFMLHNLEWLHQLDIQYDLSTFDTDPFEPQPENRHTIFPFRVGATGIRNGYVELPYTLPQDSTLFLLLGEKTPEIWFRKLDWIASHGGMVLVDAHPDYMNFTDAAPTRAEYPVRFYSEFLSYLETNYEGQYWHALPREIAAYHIQREASREEREKSTKGSPLLDNLVLCPTIIATSPAEISNPHLAKQRLTSSGGDNGAVAKKSLLAEKRAAVLLYSYFPDDPRPRRAAEALAAEGVAVDVVCLQKEKSEARHEVINGIHVFRLPIQRRRGSKLTYLTQYSAFILRSFIRLTRRSFSQRYDIVHVHNMPDALVFGALVPKALGAKVVLDLHDPMPELMQAIFELSESSFAVRALKRLEKISIGFVDLVFTVNLACRRIFSSRSCPANKITVVMNAPDDSIFRFKAPSLHGSNGSVRSRPFSILYHGSLVPRNGVDLAIEALKIVKDRIPDVRLMICGERNAFLEQILKSAREWRLEANVHYLGLKSQTEIVAAISESDLGIVPNQRNTFTDINTPTRIFEYLSLGKPVIAPRTPGITDYFAESDLLFFEAGNSLDLARKIEFAYAKPEAVQQVVERGQKVYIANCWARQKASFIGSIERLFAANGHVNGPSVREDGLSRPAIRRAG